MPGADLDAFFFQAEDGIRDHCVTGVQTCALPISSPKDPLLPPPGVDLPPEWTWMRFELSSEMELEKRLAIGAHRSQLATPYLRLLLASFVRTNELFAVRPADLVASHPQ